MVMLPPDDADDHLFGVLDAVDVPIVVRSTGRLRRPSEVQWKSAVDPWTALGQLPGDGVYLATTTWRQILQAATGVGRDLAPWLRKTPWLAVNEFIARVAPLQAYLCMKDVPGPEHAAGRRLFVSAVYQHGTERSAHSAFGYHLGMTMAQWACVGMSGLGNTRHIEAGGPNGNQGFLNASLRLPDLWGTHPSPRLPWLVEAKAGRHLGEGRLKDGKVQLNGGSDLMTVPHRQVLCGTSLPHRKRWEDDHLFMTIDTTSIAAPPVVGGSALSPLGPAPDGAEEQIAEDVEALLVVARSQLLAYQAIAFGAVEDLRLVPVSKARSARFRAPTGSLTPVEHDEPTRQIRHRLRSESVTSEAVLRSRGDAGDFIAARLPGTGIHLGMSRRLFAACAALHQAQSEMPVSEPLFPPDTVRTRHRVDDEEREEHSRATRRAYYEQEEERGPHLRARIHREFVQADAQSWSDLLSGRHVEVPLGDPEEGGLLEGTTAETYLAIERTEPVLGNSERR
ncbi:gamma-glutamyltransferase [Streptomyces sp. NPDC092903]|uniref:gamma-glutamyltransferase n=1 Tax=Streptomyces sp. NPDC092903 TaxID=3366017 RepID=UPI0038025300